MLTSDPALLHRFWLAAYAPEVIDTEARRHPAPERIAAALGGDVEVRPVPVPAGCVDGFGEAYFGRPEALLDPGARRANSAWGFVGPKVHARFERDLRRDLASGAWDARWGALRTAPSFEGSLVLVRALPCGASGGATGQPLGATIDGRRSTSGPEGFAHRGRTSVLSIVYSSAAERPFSADDLAALLQQSRASNEEHDLTGLLVYREGRFLQLIEGPDQQVHERMRLIEADPRHGRIRVLLEEGIPARQFPEWTMGYEGPVDGATEVPGYRRTFDDLDVDRSVSGTLPALRALLGWFRERHDA